MSIHAYCTAVRNHLRENLQNFYTGSADAVDRNCKVMYDEQPTADCGQEFIAIYGSYHKPHTDNLMQAIDEEFGLNVSVSRKISVVPPDYRGELGYLTLKNLPESVTEDDAERWNSAWLGTETRCREIVKLLVGPDRYSVMNSANAILTTGSPITEPLIWLGTDAVPRRVGPEHFYSYADIPPDADPIFGLVMSIYFGKAVRMQPSYDLDLLV